MRHTGFIIWLLLAVLMGLPFQVNGAIYTFVDESGTLHFTNVPNDPRYQPVNPKHARSRIVPGDPLRYDEHIREAARRYQIDPLLIKAVIKAESNFDCRAVSRKGAQGLMQLMPETARDLKIYDPFDPQANILGGTLYLKRLLERFDGDLKLVLAAYNAGPSKVETLGRIPRIPETQTYVRKVLWNYRKMTEESSPHKRWVGATY